MPTVTVESLLLSDSPALILDIDGVLQPYPTIYTDGYIPNPEHKWLSYNPEHGDWLRRQQEFADCYYISDWREKSHDIIGQYLGLPELDYIDTDPYKVQSTSEGMARALAITALFGSRPVAWLDDLDNKEKCTNIARTLMTDRQVSGIPTLFVKTNMHIGLEQHHMQEVDAWLESLNK